MNFFSRKYFLGEDCNLGATFFCVILSFALALSYWLARYGFDHNSLQSIFLITGLSLAMLFMPDLIRVAKKRFSLKDSWYISKPAVLLFTLLSLALAASFLPFFISIVLSLSGFAMLIYFSLVYIISCEKKYILVTICFALIFSIWSIGVAWGTGYLDPLFLEKITTGKAALDTLFHIDVSNMIKNYSIPSTGLDGLPLLNYHFASHVIFAEFSKFLRLPSVYFYNLAYPVIFIPFLIRSLLLLVEELRKQRGLKVDLDFKSWLILLVGFTGLLPIGLMGKLGYGTFSIFISESYLISFSFTFLFLAIAVNFFKKKNIFVTNFSDYVFLLFFTPLMLILIGFSKISLCYLLFVSGIYLFFKYKLFKKLLFVIALIISALAVLIVIKFASIDSPTPILFFAYIKQYVMKDFATFFFIAFYFLAWIYLYLRLKSYTVNNLYIAWRKSEIIEVEILLIFMLAGFLPGALFDITAGNAAYFMDPQRWLALSLLVAYNSMLIPNSQTVVSKKIQNLKITSVIAVLFFMILIFYSFSNIFLMFKSFLISNVQMRTQILPTGDELKTKGHLIYFQSLRAKNISSFQAFDMVMKRPQQELDQGKNESYLLLKYLQSLDDQPQQKKDRSAIFIPQQNSTYWNMNYYKQSQFVAPAVSGRAMINGIQPYIPEEIELETINLINKDLDDAERKIVLNSFEKSEENATFYHLRKNLTNEESLKLFDIVAPFFYASLKNYGYWSYRIDQTENQYLEATTDLELCRKARSQNFERIIKIGIRDNGVPIGEELVCRSLN